MVPRPALGYAMVALAAALFAVNGTVSKIILGSEISAQQLTEVRCPGALVGLTLIAFATRPSSLRLQRSELPLLVALGVGGLALVQWSYFFAIHRVEIGIALVIQFVGPILVALWARFVYGEHVRRRIWLALVLALTGLVLIVELWKAQRPDGAGLAAAALAAVTYAGYILLAERGVRRRDPISLSAWGFLFATLFWSVLAPWWHFPAARADNRATRAGITGMLEPVLAIFVAWAWLGETLNLLQASGATVTLAGIAIAQTSR